MSTVSLASSLVTPYLERPKSFSWSSQKGKTSRARLLFSTSAREIKMEAGQVEPKPIAQEIKVGSEQGQEKRIPKAVKGGSGQVATETKDAPPPELTEPALGWAARDKTGRLAPFKFKRRSVGPFDVKFSVKYCGICHSDLHKLRDEWEGSIYPMVPGHEIVGVVIEVGSKVTKFKPGDRVGVGLIVNSCKHCPSCDLGLEQYCDNKFVWSFSDIDHDGTITYGGYSNIMVSKEDCTLRMPDNLPLAGMAPLLCAGITVYSPMKYYHTDEAGKKFAVVGLGGLGHMAVKFAKAFGMHVTVITNRTSAEFEKDARENLGVDDFILNTDDEQMKAAVKSLDFILDAVAAPHPTDPYLDLLKVNGKLILVGLPPGKMTVSPSAIIFGRKTVGGSLIGGIAETQEMLDFCGKHNITSDIETIPINYINEAMERLAKGDVHYRFVIDIENSLKEEE